MTVILIGGDVCPIGRNEPLFRKGAAAKIFSNLLSEFEQADYTVVNLECPLILQESPIEKDGANLGASVECVNGLKAAGIDAVNLANNHILDHGETGVRSTLATCEKSGIVTFGAGENLGEAGKILITKINNKNIGFLGIAEHEFNIAGKDTCGANPLDIIEIARALRKTKDKLDFLTILVHGGREHYQYPSPRLQQLCRFLIEEGAGAVICQHSHCAGCYEYYEGRPIVYGQGNLIFDSGNKKQRIWHEGFLVKLCLNKDNECVVNWIPYLQSWNGPGARRMSPRDEQNFIQALETRAHEIQTDGTIEHKWLEYCRAEKYLYASRMGGHNRLLRYLNRRLHFSDWLQSKETKLMLRNVVECEVHREALETLWRDKDTDF